MAADTFQLKRGSTAAVNAYLPAIGEPVYNTTTKALTIGDGVTMGGVVPGLTNGNLIALAGLVGAADTGFYFTGPSAMSTYTLSALGRTLGGIATSAAGRSALGAAAIGANTDITSITGSAASLTTTRSISATGDATWTINFNGTANATAALTLATTGVGANTYGSVTVNTKGLVTAGSVITPVANGGTGLSALAAGIQTFWSTPSSANLLAAVTDETGTGSLVFATAPVLSTPTIDSARAAVLQRSTPTTKTTSFTLAANESWIVCNGAGTITVTLPAVGAAAGVGREVMFRNIAAQTVVSSASNIVPLIGGAATTAILPATAGKWVTLVSDGSNWQIMQGN